MITIFKTVLLDIINTQVGFPAVGRQQQFWPPGWKETEMTRKASYQVKKRGYVG